MVPPVLSQSGQRFVASRRGLAETCSNEVTSGINLRAWPKRFGELSVPRGQRLPDDIVERDA